MKICRIVFTILCAICLAALPIVGVFGGMDWLVVPLFLAGVFFMLMMACKNTQLKREQQENPTATPDFLNPAPQVDEEKPQE